MKTVKYFYDDLYAVTLDSHVVASEAKDDTGITLILDRTIFFPTGGGQSCDLGSIAIPPDSPFKVVDVHEDEEYVYHELTFGSVSERDAALKQLLPGVCVALQIDWDRRFDNMQRHCGEHILSGIFYREYGGVNRGFHMGNDYMTLDISLEENPAYKELTYDMCKHVELCANEVIWSNAPVTRRVYQTKEECKDLPLRKALAIEKDISIVCVGDISNAADCVACCGTHPSTAGQVGLIKIFKVEVNKGMFRVYCEAGKRAYLDYEFKHDFFAHMAGRLSATKDTIYEQLKHDDDKVSAIRNELYQLKKSVIAERSAALAGFFASGSSIIQSALEGTRRESDSAVLSIPAELSEGGCGLSNCVVTKEYNDLKIDDLFDVVKPLDANMLPKLLILVTRSNNACVLISQGKAGGVICGTLVKENAGIYGGKGGGRDNSARAIFENEESLDMFIKLLRTHLLGKYSDF